MVQSPRLQARQPSTCSYAASAAQLKAYYAALLLWHFCTVATTSRSLHSPCPHPRPLPTRLALHCTNHNTVQLPKPMSTTRATHHAPSTDKE